MIDEGYQRLEWGIGWRDHRRTQETAVTKKKHDVFVSLSLTPP